MRTPWGMLCLHPDFCLHRIVRRGRFCREKDKEKDKEKERERFLREKQEGKGAFLERQRDRGIPARNLLDYIYPPRCPICDGVSAKGICDACRKKIVFIRDDYCMKCGKPLEGEEEEYCPDCRKRAHAFEAGRSVFSYRGDLRRSLYRLKYNGKQEYGIVFGQEMAREAGSWIRRIGVTRIVPVPLHAARQRERGYNQAAIPARELGRLLGIPVEEELLYRTKRTVPLKTLNGSERRVVLSHAFAVRGSIRPGECILLVDDIYTTGSTADAAAACLKRAGKCRVYVLTVAIGG